MTIPKKLKIEFDDGSSRCINFSSLSQPFQQEILKIADVEDQQTDERSYVLLQWKDGWQEVFSVSHKSAKLLRYYTINRIEETGRLSLNVGNNYPLLFTVKRLPRDVEKIYIINDDGALSYKFDNEYEMHEGIYECGGKKEFHKYDDIEGIHVNCQMDSSTVAIPDELDAMLDRDMERQDTEKIDTTANEESSISGQDYREVAKNIGVRGFMSDSDVQDFIHFLLSKKLETRVR